MGPTPPPRRHVSFATSLSLSLCVCLVTSPNRVPRKKTLPKAPRVMVSTRFMAHRTRGIPPLVLRGNQWSFGPILLSFSISSSLWDWIEIETYIESSGWLTLVVFVILFLPNQKSYSISRRKDKVFPNSFSLTFPFSASFSFSSLGFMWGKKKKKRLLIVFPDRFVEIPANRLRIG